MATNLVALNVYQFNQINMASSPQSIAFPTQGFLVRNTASSPTRALSPTVNVYAALQAADGTLYYVQETAAQVITLFNS